MNKFVIKIKWHGPLLFLRERAQKSRRRERKKRREEKKMCLQRPPPTTHVAPLGQPHRDASRDTKDCDILTLEEAACTAKARWLLSHASMCNARANLFATAP
jgi:hypothetical protein